MCRIVKVRPYFSTINTYFWGKRTEQSSFCVVTNHYYDRVVLASSYENSVTLNPVNISIPPLINEYHYTFLQSHDKFYVQDICTPEMNALLRDGVSVVGYMIPGLYPSQHEAWYGSVNQISAIFPMRNKNYFRGGTTSRYEHYKIKDASTYFSTIVYTGGYFQDEHLECVLFGTPMQIAKDCDIEYSSLNPALNHVIWDLFTISGPPHSQPENYDFISNPYPMFYDHCSPFKGEEAPEMVIAAEDESEIIAFDDCIIVKDIPNNTNYQIYSVVGQLIQVGTTNPNISIAQLNKGIYILQLEGGKVFKFVR